MRSARSYAHVSARGSEGRPRSVADFCVRGVGGHKAGTGLGSGARTLSTRRLSRIAFDT